jgi:2'-5' RNA ligase
VAVRLFAAADLPEGVREALADWGAAAAGASAALRPVPAERLHLTLVFLGSRAAEEAERIGELVTGCADGAVPAALGDVLWLSPRRPHVLTVGLRDPTGRIGELQGRVQDALVAGAGHEAERRRYLPHVTVARVRRGTRLSPGDLALPEVPRAAFALEALTLYRSNLGPSPRYEALARVPLA